jgi:hypothetical protein
MSSLCEKGIEQSEGDLEDDWNVCVGTAELTLWPINPPEPQEMDSRESATVNHEEHAEIQLSDMNMWIDLL